MLADPRLKQLGHWERPRYSNIETNWHSAYSGVLSVRNMIQKFADEQIFLGRIREKLGTEIMEPARRDKSVSLF